MASNTNIGINKTRRILTELVDMKLMSRIEVRKSGQFIEHVYFLHLKPLHGNREVELHHFTETVTRSTVHGNGGAYKEITPLKRKEEKERFSQNSKPQKPNLEYSDYVRSIESDQRLSLPEGNQPILPIEQWLLTQTLPK